MNNIIVIIQFVFEFVNTTNNYVKKKIKPKKIVLIHQLDRLRFKINILIFINLKRVNSGCTKLSINQLDNEIKLLSTGV